LGYERSTSTLDAGEGAVDTAALMVPKRARCDLL